jgi:hypothetical protein
MNYIIIEQIGSKTIGMKEPLLQFGEPYAAFCFACDVLA